MRVETNRLILREYRHDDFGGIHEILSDEETMKHYSHPFDEEETRHWILKNMERYVKDGFGLWAVELKVSP
jgi:RimJ/RimL family protein N-acetyltransferase